MGALIAWSLINAHVPDWIAWLVCVLFGGAVTLAYGMVLGPALAKREPLVKAVATLGLTLVLFAALAAVGWAGFQARAAMTPPWVRRGVVTLRGFFPGAPKPERVTWGVGAKGRWVTIYDRTDCPLGDQHVIVDINGTTITSSTDLSNALVSLHPGDSVRLQWVNSSGQTQTATVVLTSGPPS